MLKSILVYTLLLSWAAHAGYTYAQSDPEAIRIFKQSARSSFDIDIPDKDSFAPEAVQLESEGMRLLWTRGRSRQGARLLEQALAKEPRLVLAASHLALYYQRGLKDRQRAVAVLEKAIKYHQNYPGLYFDLANVFAYAKNHPKAICYFLKAEELGFAEQPSLHYNLANSYFYERRYPEAIRSYKKALMIDPTHEDARKNLLLACMKSNKIDTALEYAGTSVDLIKRIAVSLSRAGRYAEALRVYEQAIKLNPDDFETQFNRALTLEKLNRPQEALDGYHLASQISPEDPDPFYNSAILMRKLGRNDSALCAIDRAISIAPQREQLHFARAIILVGLKQYDEALKSCDITLRTNPRHNNAARAKETLLKMMQHKQQP
jgi:tetratricopeptide (TPR) repeat protein